MNLPIYSVADSIVSTIINNPNKVTLVIGETGSGKSTQLPQLLLPHYNRIVISQPRRVAATGLSDRVASELKDSGVEVGYKVRFDDKVTEKTRIVFVTDGILLNIMVKDIDEFDLVIIDEAHERSLQTDIMFALMKKIMKERPAKIPKFVIMSATLETEKFIDYFDGCDCVHVPGRHFQVDITYLSKKVDGYHECLRKCVDMGLYVHQNMEAGDILCFLTGRNEIEDACQTTREILEEENLKDLHVLPFYASLDPQLQKTVLSPSSSTHRRIIYSTNVAATSITIPNIRYVIDSGHVKQKHYHTVLDMEMLTVTNVSKAEADQRAGRAGRLMHGKCWRMYTRKEYEEFENDTVPEILRSSLTSTVLFLKNSGIENLDEIELMDSPCKEDLIKACKRCWILGALDDYGVITREGVILSKIPISPALGVSLLKSCEFGCSKEVLGIVSLLSVEDLFISYEDEKPQFPIEYRSKYGDHMSLLQLMSAYNRSQEKYKFCSAKRLRFKAFREACDIQEQLKKILDGMNLEIKSCLNMEKESERSKIILKSFLYGFASNIAKKKHMMNIFYNYASSLSQNDSNNYLGLSVHPSSSLMVDNQCPNDIEWVFYHEIIYQNKAYMRMVSYISMQWVDQKLIERLKENIEAEYLVGGKRELVDLEKKKKIEEESRRKEKEDQEKKEKEEAEQARTKRINEAKERFLMRKKQKSSD